MPIVSVARVIAAALLMLLSMSASPVRAQVFGCAPGLTPTDTKANGYLGGLLSVVQGKWPTAAKKIDPLAVPPNPDIKSGAQITSCPSGSGPGTLCFIHLGLTTCEHITTNYNVSSYAGLSGVTVKSLSVGSNFNLKDVTSHGAWGPDAGKVTDGVFAPNGTDWNSEFYAVVLGNSGVQSAITIDLGSKVTICGGNLCAPYIQADRHNMELDYWDEDQQTWQMWGATCESSGSGLIARPVIPSTTSSVKCGTSVSGANFTTQYVRLWALSGADDNNFSISEILLRDGSKGNVSTAPVISTGKVATGPRPYRINDGFAPKDGTAWNDSTAVVLRNGGPGNAVAIDLGGKVNLCVGNNSCMKIQADKNVYELDYSVDGLSWVNYGELPAVSSSGLQTRYVVPTSAISSATTGVLARYVRIWGCAPSECPDSGDSNFSVSEMTITNTSGANVALYTSDFASFSPSAYGPERVATNGEPTADSSNVDWDDPRFAIVLSPCVSNAAQPCAQLGTVKPTTGPMFVDLTGTFPISSVVFQGDRHQFQVDYFDPSSNAWKSLRTVPSSTSDGLSTRSFTPSSPPLARYLQVYGTSGDDNHYSISSLKVLTPQANTPCSYDSAANYNQPFGCSYDAALLSQFSIPGIELFVSFTIDSASSQLHCTNGTTTENWTALKYPAGTTCTAVLTPSTPPGGGYCSGSCTANEFVTTNVSLDPPQAGVTPPAFTLTNLQCSNPVQKEDSNIPSSAVTNFTDGLITFAETIAAEAVIGLFNGVTAQSLPSSGASCAARVDTSNATLQGSATQVGSNDDNGHVRLSGATSIPASTRLDTLGLTIEQVLFEAGGVEELVRTGRRNGLVPLRLELQPGSNATRATYSTAPRHVPSVRAVLTRSKRGTMKFDIQVDRARMPSLPRCDGAAQTAALATRFTLDDAGKSITVRARQNWACEGNQLRTQ